MTEASAKKPKSREFQEGYNKGLVRGVGIGLVGIAAVLCAEVAQPHAIKATNGNASSTAEANPSETTQEKNCTPGKIPEHSTEVEMSISDSELERTTNALLSAESFEQAAQLLTNVFKRWDYTVHVAKVPTISVDDGSTRAPSVEHDPSLITQRLLNVSSVHILESLAKIPEPLLEAAAGGDLYLTTDIVGESGYYGGLYGHDTNDRPYMVVSIGESDPSGEIFAHEFTHRLFDAICGSSSDPDIAKLNPSGFKYTRIPKDTAYWYGITASSYGASNTAEDIAELFPLVFDESYQSMCAYKDEDSHLVVCNKLEFLLKQIASVSPESAAYLFS